MCMQILKYFDINRKISENQDQLFHTDDKNFTSHIPRHGTVRFHS